MKTIKDYEQQIAKLQAFKDYVHQRLDDAGIEKEPNGEHSRHGCRIGDRLDIALTKVGNLSEPGVSGRFYQVDFGTHLCCKVKVTDNEIEVQGAVNGWGNSVPLEQVAVVELNSH